MENKKEFQSFKDLLFELILPRVELISLVLIVIALWLKVFKIQGAADIFMISMSTYAGTCHLSAFKPSNITGHFGKLIIKLGGIASAILVIGTLFLILNLHGGKQMFTIGAPAFVIAFILTLIKNTNSESEEYKDMLKRHFRTFGIITIVYLVAIYIG